MGSAVVTEHDVETPPVRQSRRLDPVKLGAYLAAVALWVVVTVFFGRYGFFLGLAVLVLVKVGFWAVPLVKLSYRSDPHESQPPQQ
jgi:hypothetical protein